MTQDLFGRVQVCDIEGARQSCRCCSAHTLTKYANKHDYQLNAKFAKMSSQKFSRADPMQNCDFRNLTEKRLSSDYSLPSICVQFKKCYILYIFLCLLSFSTSLAEFNSCDFIGSGLDMDGVGVQPVYLSCTAGQITWQFPRAALRIMFRLPQSSKEFRGCIKAAPKIEGARLFVEGHRTLVPIYASGDGKPHDSVRCFTSYNGQAALYFEAEPSVGGFNKQVAAFEYDLQPLSNGEIYDPMEECRPCSDSELLSLYCSADFAAKGSIIDAKNDPTMSRTVITFKAARVFQQTTPIFSSPSLKQRPDSADGGEFNALQSSDLGGSSLHTGKLYVPFHCGARAGPGQFLVLGTVRLGEPILKCAPRLEEWAILVKRAAGSAHCSLEV